jgi:hypothetical protein
MLQQPGALVIQQRASHFVPKCSAAWRITHASHAAAVTAGDDCEEVLENDLAVLSQQQSGVVVTYTAVIK